MKHNCLANTQSRVDYIDLFRAYGIILMIMGHIGFGNAFDKWIHAFHMPMFFFISGYFFRKKRIQDQMISKAKTLLLPYFAFGIVQLCFLAIFSENYRSIEPIKLYIWENTNGMQPVPGALWFLTSLFIAEIVYSIICSISLHEWIAHFLVCVVLLMGLIIPRYLRLPWGADTAFVGVGFIHIGYTLKNKEKLSKLLELKLIPTLIFGGCITPLIFLNRSVNLRTGQYEFFPLFLINAVGAIIVGWNISRFMFELFYRGKLSCTVIYWMVNIGKNSIVYLCLNQLCILIFSKLLSVIGISGVFSKILVFLLVILILAIMEQLICRTKLRYLIGRK